MVKVYFGGSFEILNCGHIKCFEMAKKQGDFLIVGLNTNELLESYKHRQAVFPFEEKKIILESIRFIDQVVPVDVFSPLQILKDLDIDVYCCADEWRPTKDEEIAYMQAQGKRVVYIPDFGLTRTSQIKERLLVEALAKKSK